jgi:hypothetical protein
LGFFSCRLSRQIAHIHDDEALLVVEVEVEVWVGVEATEIGGNSSDTKVRSYFVGGFGAWRCWWSRISSSSVVFSTGGGFCCSTARHKVSL